MAASSSRSSGSSLIAKAADRRATPTVAGAPLGQRGINYDVGTHWPYDSGAGWQGVADSRIVWSDALMRRELLAIRDDLHLNAVIIHGTDTSRLIDSARFAVGLGLTVWVQPRLMNNDQATTLENLADLAKAVEPLRAAHPDVGLNVGVESSLFTADIIPGASFEERAVYLVSHLDELPSFDERLGDFLARARGVVTQYFGGATTYSSGQWETVEWTDFDYAGIDHYRDRDNTTTYVDQLRTLKASGKPVIVTEFGCCTFVGAENYGGRGYEIVDYSVDPPRLSGDFVRSETTQAKEILGLLDIFEAEQIQGAFVYQLVDQGLPHSSDPPFDLDMANFGIVKTFAPGMGKPDDPTYWEPKDAFHRLSERWRAGS